MILKDLNTNFNDNFYILGLPITKDSVSSEFINFINSKEPTIYIQASGFNKNTNDYLTTQVGYDILIECGINIVCLNLWNKFEIRLEAEEVCELIKEKIKEYRKDYNGKIVYVTTGSPYLYDVVCDTLMVNLPKENIIDTKSSVQLSYEIIKKIHDLPINITSNKNKTIKKDFINIVGCLGEIYSNQFGNIDNFIKTFDENTLIYDIKLGYNSIVNKILYNDLIIKIKNDRKYFNNSTIAIIK
jgi:hypothetical protein